jgi:hypothetical protein
MITPAPVLLVRRREWTGSRSAQSLGVGQVSPRETTSAAAVVRINATGLGRSPEIKRPVALSVSLSLGVSPQTASSLMTEAMPTWRIDLRPAPRAVSESTVAAVLGVFRNGMESPQGWSVEGVRARLRDVDMVLLLRSDDCAVGYAMFDAIDVPDDPLERIILWEHSICFRRDFQRHGHGTVALTSARLSLGVNRNVGWIGGRSQSPIVFERYRRCVRPNGRLFPFDALYSESAASARAIQAISKALQRYGGGQPDVETGICRCAYRDGRVPKTTITPGGMENPEQFLIDHGFDRDRGDAVIVLADI